MSESSAKRNAFDCQPARLLEAPAQEEADAVVAVHEQLLLRIGAALREVLAEGAKGARAPPLGSARAREGGRLGAPGPHPLEPIADAERVEQVARLHAGP